MPPEIRTLSLLLFASVVTAQSPAVDAPGSLPKIIWQPVLDFGAIPHAGPVTSVNPFVSYTHLGTDFGFHGPAESLLNWSNGQIEADLTGLDLWAGMWYSLEGMAASTGESLDFAAPYPAPVRPASQPKITKIAVQARGHGQLKLEIKSPGEDLLWEHRFSLADTDSPALEIEVDPLVLRRAKFLLWTAEPSSRIVLNKVELGVETGSTTVDDFALRASFAKLARCYSQGTGLLRDRAHVPHGAFDSIPASGFFALATAAVSAPEIGLVSPEAARRILHEVADTLMAIDTAHGLLPHFVRETNGVHIIHPGTEYSSVDTAIAYQSLLLAAAILGDAEVMARVLSAIQEIDFATLTLPDGTISHGMREDGKTVIPYSWRDWGGESALVVLLRALADPTAPAAMMANTGHPWQGTGFIAEIQSLFHPDFAQPIPDALGVNWLTVRRSHLAAQKQYWPKHHPECTAAKLNLYGLSASESVTGTSYQVNGVDLTGQDSLQPHYLMMSAALDPDPALVRASLRQLLDNGWLAPWGMVETFSADGHQYLPMIGSLNAGFEALGAYHFVTNSRQERNVIYDASRSLPEMRAAMRVFYR